jgi:hypothetical protein
MAGDIPFSNSAVGGGPALTDAAPMPVLVTNGFRLGVASGRRSGFPVGNFGNSIVGTFISVVSKLAAVVALDLGLVTATISIGCSLLEDGVDFRFEFGHTR